MDPAPYEVEFMNVVVDKANDLQVTDADSHFAQFAGVHPSKIKQGKLFLYDKLKPADRERVMQNICKKGARFTYMTMDLLDQKGTPLFVHCVGQNYEDSTLCRMTFADVSESRRRQEQLRAQAVEMNELIDLVCGGVCLFKVTPEMHIECLYLNKGCCRLFGTSQESSRLGPPAGLSAGRTASPGRPLWGIPGHRSRHGRRRGSGLRVPGAGA